VISSQFSTTNGTSGPTRGQSFSTGAQGGVLSKILTNAIGGVSGTQLTNGVAASVLKIREYVNDDETGITHGLTGNVLATSVGAPTILNYDFGASYPTAEFLFDESLTLAPNTTYVIEIVAGSGVSVYVKTNDPYAGGKAFDIDGINLTLPRDYPFSLYLKY
jgi:hypothetical protein